MRDLYRDAEKAGLSLLAGMALAPGLFILLLVVAFAGGRCSKATIRKDRIVALRDTVRLTDSLYVAQTETVTVYRERSARAKAASDAARASSDSAKAISDSIDHLVQTTDFELPPLVVMDLQNLRYTVAKQDTTIRKQDSTIKADSVEKRMLYGRDSTQEWRIATRDKMLRELGRQAHPRCGRRCGMLLGALSIVAIQRAVK